MEAKTKYRTPSSATIAVIAIAMVFGVIFGTGISVNTNIQGRDIVSVEVIHADGSREPTQYIHNVVTNYGLNFTRDAISGLNGTTPIIGNNWTVIELSTSTVTPSASNSTCPNIVSGNGLGIGRATTVIKQNTGNFTASITFTVTGTQNGIQTVCLGNSTVSATPNSLMAIALLPNSVNVQNTDTLIVNHSVAWQ